jgi:hypothetical protein
MHPHTSHLEKFPDMHYLYFVTDNCITIMDRLLFMNTTDSCHSFHGCTRHPVLMPVTQMNKHTITHSRTEQC